MSPRKNPSTRVANESTPARLGTHLVRPAGVQKRYGITHVTRWRWERDKKLPPRDVFIGGKAVGWRPDTLDAAERHRIRSDADPGALTECGARQTN